MTLVARIMHTLSVTSPWRQCAWALETTFQSVLVSGDYARCYVIEYGGTIGDPALNITDDATINVVYTLTINTVSPSSGPPLALPALRSPARTFLARHR